MNEMNVVIHKKCLEDMVLSYVLLHVIYIAIKILRRETIS
jgi:hypothetical protein